MYLKSVDSWLTRQPIARKLDALIVLSMILLGLVLLVQILSTLGGLQMLHRTRELHQRSVESLTLEKDLASLERDVFKAVADPTPETIAAAEKK